MEKRDYRSASAEERAASRRAAIKLIKAGQRKGKVAECFGVSANTITNWLKRYDNQGVQSFRDKPRGVKSEDKKLLSDSQEREIQKMITVSSPLSSSNTNRCTCSTPLLRISVSTSCQPEADSCGMLTMPNISSVVFFQS